MTWQNRFDRLLKAMSEGEKPSGHKESEGPTATKNRAAKEDKRP